MDRKRHSCLGRYYDLFLARGYRYARTCCASCGGSDEGSLSSTGKTTD